MILAPPTLLALQAAPQPPRFTPEFDAACIVWATLADADRNGRLAAAERRGLITEWEGAEKSTNSLLLSIDTCAARFRTRVTPTPRKTQLRLAALP